MANPGGGTLDTPRAVNDFDAGTVSPPTKRRKPRSTRAHQITEHDGATDAKNQHGHRPLEEPAPTHQKPNGPRRTAHKAKTKAGAPKIL